jgi:hypothetical protein
MTTNPVNSEQQRIISVANELITDHATGGSTSEQIAAAFILNNPEYLPGSYPVMVEAWDRLGDEWQQHVRTIREHYRHLIQD